MSWSPSSPSPVGSSGGRRLRREQTVGSTGESFLDSEVVPSSLVEITPILRVANKVEAMNPRVAYLCRLYAYEKAQRLDPTSSGRGVRQFKTVLLQRLERDKHPTWKGMVHETDALEMERFYREYYKKFIRAPQNDADNKADRALLTESYQIAASLFEVLKAVMISESAEVDIEVLHAHGKVQENRRLYEAYNILPLAPECTDQSIMRFPEIQAAVYALRGVRGLPWPNGYEKNNDLLDWLQAMFGFQKDNVSNQREHMILLLANVQIRHMPRHEQQQQLDDQALNTIMKRLFKNYKKWCKYLCRKSSLWLPTTQKEIQKHKLLYMGLYFLIWGEAANLRFMPECLCYIFHHMAFELYSVLAGHVSPITGESIKPAYGGDEEAFLLKVVTPVYKVIEKEAERSKCLRLEHSHWRNYDDLNEYFWSVDCFRLGWPMRADADFFNPFPILLNENRPASNLWMGKVNFVELRSFWHTFHSFNRMWIFLVLSLQAMIIMAWNCGTACDSFDVGVAKQVLSIFITAGVLQLGQAILDIVFVWKARRSMPSTVTLRYFMKLLSAATWAVVLPVTYTYIWENQPSLYILAVTIYLTPSLLGAMLFYFPLLKRFLENSDFKVLIVIMWWLQPRVFVGRGMHESAISFFKYTMFWVLLLAAKFAVNFYIEIKPLVLVTKNIIGADRTRTSKWNEFFLHANSNIGVIIALWAPIILVYFMDTQIWYAIFSSFIGGIYGAFQGLGMIREFGMFRSYFESFPCAFNECLIPSDQKKIKGFQDPTNMKDHVKFAARFAKMWNLIITSFREEDLVDDREMNLLLLPYFQDRELDIFQWPAFLLASKIPTALDMVANSHGKDRDFKRRINRDPYMNYAIRECYALFRNIVTFLVIGQFEKRVIQDIFEVVDHHIHEDTLIRDLDMMKLPSLTGKFIELLELLLFNKEEDHGRVVLLFQDMLEVVTTDILEEQHNLLLDQIHDRSNRTYGRTTSSDQLFTTGIMFPVEGSNAWFEKIKRLLLLLTMKESAMDVPSNLEARRRMLFFTNSLFMGIPCAPKVQNMLPFCVLTHYHNEDVLFSLHDIEEENIDGVSILFYLQKIYPDEWKNFLERVAFVNEEELHTDEASSEQLRLWASYRASTLTRSVRGTMYYRKALELQAYLDMATHEDLTKDYTELMSEDPQLMTQCKAIADMKFTYVVSCQQYGTYKRSGDQRAHDILRLMTRYPSIRVAYIDEIEECNIKRNSTQKVYYSTLVKASVTKPDEPGQSHDQVIYKIKLPGNIILGEVKSENQNHAMIFTRGECLQTIGVNQDHYLEETLKMRNLLQEFLCKHDGVRYPSILGIREQIFTGSVSRLAWLFASSHEKSFVTIGQRMLANPLRVRFHYGNSDIFDRIFHLTRGGVSKASKLINLSEDIFGGFNSTLRGGHVSHHEYMQIGKGRNAHFDQISLLEAKVANGNGEQTLSRDIHRLGHHFDFFRMFSCYYTTIGFYCSAMITVWTVYVFLYGRLYLLLIGCDDALASGISVLDRPLQAALASESFVQLGFLMVLPMIIEIVLERGFRTACSEFILMQLQLSSVFFTFSLGTKSHYYGKTLLHGANEFRATGRRFVEYHAKFAYTYQLYARSHFVKGIELLFLLVVCEMFGHSDRGAIPYLFTISVWFMVGSWLFAPFLFNPSGFEWQNIMDDWADWNKWINFHGGIGIAPEKSWESWWEKEQLHLGYSGRYGTILEILFALRFFIYQFGLVYHWSQIKHARSVVVYACSWAIFFVIFLAMKTVSVSRRRFSSPKFQLAFRLIKGLITIIPILVISIRIPHITAVDIFVCVLSLMPAGWGMLLIAQTMKPIVMSLGFWGPTKALARRYDMAMGLLLFAPVAFLACFPVVSEFQTRILFNQAFNRGLQVSRILGKHKKG